MSRIRPFDRVRSLFGLSPSQTTPLWLELARRQAGRRGAKELAEQWRRDGFVAPAGQDQRLVHRWDGAALQAAREFEAVQLSPVAPLGVCSVVAPTSQDRVLAAARGTEVVSDPTNVLALVCAGRLAVDPDRTVRLCTVHQVLRAQALPESPGFSRHFRLFCLAEAERGRPEHAFEVEAFVRHLETYDRLFDAGEELGLRFPGRHARLLVARDQEALGERIRERLASRFPGLEVAIGKLESSYYDGVRLLYGAEDKEGERPPIADIGRFDWVARLAANRRLRFVASGFGLQLALARYSR